MTAATSPWFRDLYDEIMAYDDALLFRDVLAPWIEKAQSAVSELSRFKTLSVYDSSDECAQQAMWNLYALGRVNDLLLISFQDGVEPAFAGSAVTRDEYVEFFSQLGFAVIEPGGYSSFLHEIVRVQQSSKSERPIDLADTVWPGLMWGEMLFSRSGVAVTGGCQHVVKEIAEKSTLYFTSRRQQRKTSDLSAGWGSNSQWRTQFRRDYQIAGVRIYNADGKHLLKAGSTVLDESGLTTSERIELCRNRCFVVTAKEDSDLWPYDDRYEERLDESGQS